MPFLICYDLACWPFTASYFNRPHFFFYGDTRKNVCAYKRQPWSRPPTQQWLRVELLCPSWSSSLHSWAFWCWRTRPTVKNKPTPGNFINEASPYSTHEREKQIQPLLSKLLTLLKGSHDKWSLIWISYEEEEGCCIYPCHSQLLSVTPYPTPSSLHLLWMLLVKIEFPLPKKMLCFLFTTQ